MLQLQVPLLVVFSVPAILCGRIFSTLDYTIGERVEHTQSNIGNLVTDERDDVHYMQHKIATGQHGKEDVLRTSGDSIIPLFPCMGGFALTSTRTAQTVWLEALNQAREQAIATGVPYAFSGSAAAWLHAQSLGSTFREPWRATHPDVDVVFDKDDDRFGKWDVQEKSVKVDIDSGPLEVLDSLRHYMANIANLGSGGTFSVTGMSEELRLKGCWTKGVEKTFRVFKLEYLIGMKELQRMSTKRKPTLEHDLKQLRSMHQLKHKL